MRSCSELAGQGYTLTVTRIDRLALSIADLAAIVRELESKGVALKAIEKPIDTSTAAGRAFLQMLGVFAPFAASASLRGKKPRRPKASTKGARQRSNPRQSPHSRPRDSAPAEIARRIKIGRARVYRVAD
ncbi:MAG TPA: recombinase family protein [Roseiarcus sp.]